MKGRVYEVRLGRRGRSSYGEVGRGMRSCCPTTSQILGPPGIGFCLSCFLIKFGDAIFCGNIDTFMFMNGIFMNLRKIIRAYLPHKKMAGNIPEDVEIVHIVHGTAVISHN